MDFPHIIYSTYLEEIKGVKFTPREIDIISCILCGRATTIPSFLSISPRTVETHLRNIMSKLECNSRENIISFIESSPKYPYVKKYYQSLVIFSLFEKTLKNIKNIIAKSAHNIGAFQFSNLATKNGFIGPGLIKHFDAIGIQAQVAKQVFIEPKIGLADISELSPMLFVILVEELEKHNNGLSHYMENDKLIIQYEDIAFIVLKKSFSKSVDQENNIISTLSLQPQNYYFLFFLVLLKIFSNANLEKIVEEFVNQYYASFRWF